MARCGVIFVFCREWARIWLFKMWWMVNEACCHHWVGWCLISKCAPFLPGHHIEKLDTVLEFGGRYATTTCAIALQQENSGHINHHHHHHIILCQYLLVIHTGNWDLCIWIYFTIQQQRIVLQQHNNHHNIYQLQRSTIQGQEKRKNTLSQKQLFYRTPSIRGSWPSILDDSRGEWRSRAKAPDIRYWSDASMYRLNLSCSCRHPNSSHQQGLVVQVLTTNKVELRTYSRWTRRGMDATATHCLVPLDPKMSRSHQYQID